MLYIVVPTFNRIEIFKEFVKQMEQQTYKDYWLIAVDHGTCKTNYKGQKVTVIEGDPALWWTGAVNLGLRYILNLKGITINDYVLVINDDIIISNDYLQQVVWSIEQKPKACIGSVCYDINTKRIKHNNMILDKLKACYVYRHKGDFLNCLVDNFYPSDVLKGRGTVYPVIVLNKIGVFNEIKLPHYRADHELACRAKKNGFEVIVSKNMQIGAILNSPNTIKKNLSLFKNYNNIFHHIVSVKNLKDLWNYSFCCFNKFYGFYFWLVNFLRDHLFFFITFLKSRFV